MPGLNDLFLVGPPLPAELQVGRGPFVTGLVGETGEAAVVAALEVAQSDEAWGLRGLD